MERYKQPKRSSKKDSEQNETDFKIHKKVAHNAVECRRKQRISHYISELSSTLDTCHCGKETRSEVLQKVVDKIKELETKNEGLKAIINDNSEASNGLTEEILQKQLALLLVDHIYLVLLMISHQHNSLIAVPPGDPSPPAHNSERLGFGMQALLDTNQYDNGGGGSAHHLSHIMRYPDNITRHTHDVPGGYHHSWQPIQNVYAHPNELSSLNHQLFNVSSPPPPPLPPVLSYPFNNRPHAQQHVWRPYHDIHSSTTTPTITDNSRSNFTTHPAHQPSSSFLVGQLLENIQ